MSALPGFRYRYVEGNCAPRQPGGLPTASSISCVIRWSTHPPRITDKAKMDALWLTTFLHTFNGKTVIKPSTAQYIAFVDACLEGAGGHAPGVGYHSLVFPQCLQQCGFSISSLGMLQHPHSPTRVGWALERVVCPTVLGQLGSRVCGYLRASAGPPHLSVHSRDVVDLCPGRH